MSDFILQLTNGTRMVVPASLDSITTYVLLEQEAWFEKEVPFLESVVRPGMTVIDIGANLGVYSLPMARLAGPAGRVFAYEPGSAPRTLLERSKELNGAGNLEIVAAALSDGEREGCLATGASSELSSLSGTGAGEQVLVTTLDGEDARRSWAPPEFVKIDAEGEELKILRGGTAFFGRHSPLVMFEVKAGEVTEENLRTAFPAMGYRVYRLLPGAPILVPDRPDQALDGYELNLFAAKADRAAALASEGLLVDKVGTWQPDEGIRRDALELWKAQPFAAPFVERVREPIDPEYRDALAAYAHWRSADARLAERCAALDFACRTLATLCARDPTSARLSTLARATFEAGLRAASVDALRWAIDVAAGALVRVDEPFWPACPRYDRLVPDLAIDEWFVASLVEQFERSSGHSSMFIGACVAQIDWLCRRPCASTEMERRRVLISACRGQQTMVPARLCVPAPDHQNAEVWRAGLVPNTQVAG